MPFADKKMSISAQYIEKVFVESVPARIVPHFGADSQG
jgi:hypothetical protein